MGRRNGNPHRRFATVLAGILTLGLLQVSPALGNGHIVYVDDSAYELIDDPDQATREFRMARFLATQNTAPHCRSSHLATVTSQAEQDIVAQLMEPSDRNAWLGGFQPRREFVADAGWRWITGESWSYTAWAFNEPNDQNLDGVSEPGFEQFLETMAGDGAWNDVPNPDPVGDPKYFVVESEGCARRR